MYYIFRYLLAVCIVVNFHVNTFHPLSAVTNKTYKRLGNNLWTYCKTKALSYIYNIPFIYTPFKYSNELALDTLETPCNETLFKQFTQIIKLRRDKELFMYAQDQLPILYKCPFHLGVKNIGHPEKFYQFINDNPAFKDELRRMIKPRNPLPEPTLPKNMISVAVHVRKGGGYDPPLYSIQEYDNHQYLVTYVEVSRTPEYVDERWPIKFPPDQFYIDQIKKIYEMFDQTSLFIYIFTDDKNTKKLVNRYKKAINKPNIIFSCREEDNYHNKNVLEDFFAMFKFDCLIRPSSTFSLLAQLLGNHYIVIYPKKKIWVGNKLIITKVGIIKNDIDLLTRKINSESE